MRRTLLVIALLSIFGGYSYAQYEMTLGIKAGANYTTVFGKNDLGEKNEGSTWKPGFHAGAFWEYDVAEFVSLQIEAVFSQKGFARTYSNTTAIGSTEFTTTLDMKYSYNYVDLPFLVNLHFGQMSSYIGLGPQLSFLMGAKTDGTQTNTTTILSPPPPVSTSVDLTVADNTTDGYSKTDFGVVIGTGSKWESGIEYCIRVGYGVTNLIDPSTSSSTDLWHNFVASVSLGYGFNIGSGGGGDRYGRKYGSKGKGGRRR